MKYIRALTLFILPSFLSAPLLRLFGCKIYGKVGFSWVCVDKLIIEKGAWIGHLNFIKAKELSMAAGSYIRGLNVLRGGFKVIMDEKSIINKYNKITCPPVNNSILKMGYGTIVGTSHILELCANITIDDHSIMAGSGSQVWTHGFYHSKFPPTRWRVDGDVVIGKNVYIGTRCIIGAGVSICDNATLGAGSVVSKDLTRSGLYVNQPLRFIDFDPDQAILKHEKISDGLYKKR